MCWVSQGHLTLNPWPLHHATGGVCHKPYLGFIPHFFLESGAHREGGGGKVPFFSDSPIPGAPREQEFSSSLNFYKQHFGQDRYSVNV